MFNGFVAIDKPAGITSFDVVRKLKKIFKTGKIGHAGTLDPFATGVLPLAIGEYTKLIEYLASQSKTYDFTIKFGAQTDTGDLEGNVIATSSIMPDISAITDILSKFTGKITQTPPKYSAIKINGVRAYAMARNGEEFIIPSREIEVFSLVFNNLDEANKTASFTAKVSKGTYIRTLGEDIAIELGTLGHLISLKRTNVGNISMNQTLKLENLENMVNIGKSASGIFLNNTGILDDIPVFDVTHDMLEKLKKGQFVLVNENVSDANPIIISLNGNIVGVAKQEQNLLKPLKNLNL